MTEHRSVDDATFARASDYVDGELSAADAEAFEAELARSPDLETLVAELRALTGRARELPARIEPGRDLWPGVERRLHGDAPGLRLDRIGLRTAAVAMAAAAALVVFVMTGDDDDPGAVGPLAVAPVEQVAEEQSSEEPAPREDAGAQAMLLPQEEEYVAAIDTLSTAFASRRNRMQATTLATFEDNLRIVDGAIVSARAALAAQPHDPELMSLLDHAYGQKIDLLREATELQEWTT